MKIGDEELERKLKTTAIEALTFLVKECGHNEAPAPGTLNRVAWDNCADILGKDEMSILIGEMHRQVAGQNLQ